MRNRNREYDLAYAKKYQREHKQQVAAYNKRYRADHREYFRRKNREYREQHRAELNAYMRAYHARKYHSRYHGVDKARYLELCAMQRHLCAICRRKRRLVVDHCHATNVVRGLLCRACNTAIGLLNDNCMLFHRCISYLERRLA